jgi:predicted  nucleic acid-binding Zn-ribbon protein
MGPTTAALLRLFRADKALREAQENLDAVTKDVRAQETRKTHASNRLAAAQTRFKDLQVKAANSELDLKAREEHIEKLRNRQQQAANNKEYQALLVEINTAKVDRAKIEEATIKLMEQLELAAGDVRTHTTALQADEAKLDDMKSKLGDKATAAQAEVERLRPERNAAAAEIKPHLVEQFDKLADRFDGEAMAAIDRPNPREEEYICTGCNMGLVPNVFNSLKTRDDVITCPSCRRILYIPESMTVETAVKKRGGSKAKAGSTGSSDRVVKKVITAAPAEPENKWASLVSAAQGESARDAAEADHKPVECRVEINGELVGLYKGKSPEHLERVIRFRMEESKLGADVKVTPVEVAPAAAPAPDIHDTQTGSVVEQTTEASNNA